jgi:hypothetical protein
MGFIAICIFVLVMTLAGTLLVQSWAAARQADAMMMAVSGQTAASVALAFVAGALAILLLGAVVVIAALMWRGRARQIGGFSPRREVTRIERAAFDDGGYALENEPAALTLPAEWWGER